MIIFEIKPAGVVLKKTYPIGLWVGGRHPSRYSCDYHAVGVEAALRFAERCAREDWQHWLRYADVYTKDMFSADSSYTKHITKYQNENVNMSEGQIESIIPSDLFSFSGREFVATASACEAHDPNNRLAFLDSSSLGHGGDVSDRFFAGCVNERFGKPQGFFHIRSAKTGKLAKFVRTSEVYESGKLHSVRFICQEHGGLLATIIND